MASFLIKRCATSDELIEFDLAIRREIEIKAPAPVLWGYLNRPREWKPSIASIERIGGEPDEVGEVLRLGQRPGNEIVYTILRTLRLRRDEWKVQSLITEDGRIPSGYVVHSLYERAPHTRLVSDLLARCRFSAPEMPGRHAEEVSRTIHEGTQGKLDADFRALQRLIERA